MMIDNVEIGEGQPCRFVAELSNNHNGDLDRAFRLIEAAKESGCDFVKFQCFTPSELVQLRGDGAAPEPWGSQGWTMYELYKKAQTPLAWFPALAAKCRDVGIPWFSSVFGMESLAQLEYCGCPAYKIASFERDARRLHEAIRNTGKPTIVSRPDYPDPRFDATLFCPPGYPQAPPFSVLPQRFDGFSYHGTDEGIPTYIASKGAKIVEFHFHLADEPGELEANVSLNEYQTRRMIDDVREREFIRAA